MYRTRMIAPFYLPGLFYGSLPDPRVGSGGVLKYSRVGSARIESGQDVFKSRGSDRVGGRRFESRGLGRVGSCQEVFKSHESGRVGSGGFQISQVGPGRVKMFSKARGVGSGRVTTRY